MQKPDNLPALRRCTSVDTTERLFSSRRRHTNELLGRYETAVVLGGDGGSRDLTEATKRTTGLIVEGKPECASVADIENDL